MSIPLLVAGILSAVIGIVHAFLGEKFLLGPLFRRGILPKLLGSADFAGRTLRFAWHLTTLLLLAIGAIVVALSLADLDPQSAWILRVLAVTFAACSLLSLIGARARHFSWWVFLVIAVLLWLGA